MKLQGGIWQNILNPRVRQRRSNGSHYGSRTAALAGAITGATSGIEDANIFVIAPPAVQGLGNGNGFKMMVQDRSGAGYRALEGATFAMMGAAAQAPDQVQQVFSTYHTGSPRVAADVVRDKAPGRGGVSRRSRPRAAAGLPRLELHPPEPGGARVGGVPPH